jgi:hypothetical protein
MEDSGAPAASQPPNPILIGQREFRNIFATYLSREGTSTDDIHKLIFLAPPSVEKPAVGFPNEANPLVEVDLAYTRVRPSSLYAFGQQEAIGNLSDVESTFQKSGPITIVLVPGIFGEFIDSRLFEEVLAKTNSSGSVRFRAAVAKAVGTSDATDRMYAQSALGDVAYPLDQIVDVASIDDAKGEPLATLAFMRPKSGSLESLGTLDDNTSRYLPRIGKALRLLGNPKNVYILGYSRGTANALNIVASAARASSENPWISDVKGVIALAGVIYGTPLADATRDPDNVTGTMMRKVVAIADSLESCSPAKSTVTAAADRVKNISIWTTNIPKLAYEATQLPQYEEIVLEGIKAETPEYGRVAKMLGRILFDDTLNIDKPIRDYCENIERFKRVVHAAANGVESLTTESRLNWWRTNTIPPNIGLFSIAATMGDSTPKRGTPWPFVTNATAYDPQSIDFKSLRGNFYDLFTASQTDLNDSQVPLSRARFWPEVHALLNPAQLPLRTYFMGTLGVHHWGLAFPRAFATKDGLSANPFPRATLAKSIATFVALSQL